MLDLNDACLLLSGKRSYVSLYLTKLHRRSATTQTRRACCLSRSPARVRVDCAKNAAIPRARSPPHDDVLAASRIDARIRVRMLMVFFRSTHPCGISFSSNLLGKGWLVRRTPAG